MRFNRNCTQLNPVIKNNYLCGFSKFYLLFNSFQVTPMNQTDLARSHSLSNNSPITRISIPSSYIDNVHTFTSSSLLSVFWIKFRNLFFKSCTRVMNKRFYTQTVKNLVFKQNDTWQNEFA